MTRPEDDPIVFIEGSDNIFADIGVPDPDESLAKSILFQHIKAIIRDRKLTQGQAASLCGVDQPKMSKLLNAKLYGFSTGQIMNFLTALGRDVEIVIGPPVKRRSTKGKLTVRAA